MLLIDKYTVIDNIYDAAESIICAVEEENAEIAEKIVDVRDAILKKIEEQQTIVSEARRGRWIAQEDADGDISFVCSECSRRLRWDEDFCPSCGSDMRTADTKD